MIFLLKPLKKLSIYDFSHKKEIPTDIDIFPRTHEVGKHSRPHTTKNNGKCLKTFFLFFFYFHRAVTNVGKVNLFVFIFSKISVVI